MPVIIDGRPLEIKMHHGIPTLHVHTDVDVSLALLSKEPSPLLVKMGIYHVDTFYCDEVPLFKVAFLSCEDVKKFLSYPESQVQFLLTKALRLSIQHKGSYLGLIGLRYSVTFLGVSNKF